MGKFVPGSLNHAFRTTIDYNAFRSIFSSQRKSNEAQSKKQ